MLDSVGIRIRTKYDALVVALAVVVDILILWQPWRRTTHSPAALMEEFLSGYYSKTPRWNLDLLQKILPRTPEATATVSAKELLRIWKPTKKGLQLGSQLDDVEVYIKYIYGMESARKPKYPPPSDKFELLKSYLQALLVAFVDSENNSVDEERKRSLAKQLVEALGNCYSGQISALLEIYPILYPGGRAGYEDSFIELVRNFIANLKREVATEVFRGTDDQSVHPFTYWIYHLNLIIGFEKNPYNDVLYGTQDQDRYNKNPRDALRAFFHAFTLEFVEEELLTWINKEDSRVSDADSLFGKEFHRKKIAGDYGAYFVLDGGMGDSDEHRSVQIKPEGASYLLRSILRLEIK